MSDLYYLILDSIFNDSAFSLMISPPLFFLEDLLHFIGKVDYREGRQRNVFDLLVLSPDGLSG